MIRSRNYWSYSAALAIAWAIALILAVMLRGTEKAQRYVYTFLGFWIGWVSTTIARYIYPPPKIWEAKRRQ
jgi:hypothetical protein